MYFYTVKQTSCFITAEWLPWLHGFTVVVEANCMRQPVSLVFPHLGIRKRGGNNKETTSLVVLYNSL